MGRDSVSPEELPVVVELLVLLIEVDAFEGQDWRQVVLCPLDQGGSQQGQVLVPRQLQRGLFGTRVAPE